MATARGRAGMDHLYGQFVRPGDLVFDIGAHVGDRVACFRRLGARVVAVEPQPALVKTLKLLYGRDRCVTIEPVAIGAQAGTSRTQPQHRQSDRVDRIDRLSFAPRRVRRAGKAKPGRRRSASRVTTLDALIARHGEPSFIKLDVEGFEAEALAGLTRPVRGAVV